MRARTLLCVMLGGAAVIPITTHELVAQEEIEAGTPPRSGLWVRAGIDFGVVRVDSAHSGSGGGGHVAAGWTLSPHWTLGVRAIMNRSDSASHTLLIGPQVAWYPFEDASLALRGGVGLLDVQHQGTWLSPDGTLQPREQRYRGSLGHLALTVERPLESGVVAQLGIEVGYAPFGLWRDTSPQPVTGHPWTAAFSVTFGVN